RRCAPVIKTNSGLRPRIAHSFEAKLALQKYAAWASTLRNPSDDDQLLKSSDPKVPIPLAFCAN
ncbi:MAG TPA: hypothetical protein VFR80_12035, partial [Pyrinomonadaceae bacterium]|nr:hypothetical protein [Pyrinomonadaceae bacterium]